MSYDFKLVAEQFTSKGIKHAFGVTGSGNSLALIDALQQLNVDYHPVAHEAAAALMAGAASHDGISRAIAITIKGPGIANLLPGVVSNCYEARPAISISEAYSVHTPDHQMHKRLSHGKLLDGIAKGTFSLDDSGRCIAQAIRLARAEMPGPCHIEMAAVPAENSEFANPIDEDIADKTDPSALELALNQIKKSERPAVVLGKWAARFKKSPDWNELNIPVVTTAAAKGCIDEFLEISGGIITGEVSEYSPENNILMQADLIVAFGLRNHEVVKPLPFHCPLLAVDELQPEAPEGFSPDRILTVATVGEIDHLINALKDKHWGQNSLERWRNKVENWVLQSGWQPGRALRAIELAVSEVYQHPRLVLDTGFFCTIGETIWRCRTADEFVSSSAGRFLGVSVPTAIGLAIKDASSPVICVAGDGGIPPYVSEIRLAIEQNLPVAFVLMSDGGYGSVAAFSDNSPAVLRATTTLADQWWRSIETMGCNAYEVENEERLYKIFSNWKIENGPIFIEMKFAADNYREIAKALR